MDLNTYGKLVHNEKFMPNQTVKIDFLINSVGKIG